MPTVQFIYSLDGEPIGETDLIVGPIVRAFVDGEITVTEYSALMEQQDEANQSLRQFMYGDQPPDFMLGRVARLRGWLANIINGVS